MQQVMKMLKTVLAMQEDMEAQQAKMEADRKAHKEEFLAKMDASRKEAEAMRNNMEARPKKMMEWSTDTNDNHGLPREYGGTSRRREADLSGDET
jgi:hypothetical protein